MMMRDVVTGMKEERDTVELKVRQQVEKVDFLIIGGGIGGLQAAITGAEKGLKTLVVEKADTRRSGCAVNGNDHFACYIPECHGKNLDFSVREMSKTMDGGVWQDMEMLKTWMERSYEVVKQWESYGICMRPNGDWNFEGHTFPGQQSYHLKYEGGDIKAVLTRQAEKSGCRIMNRTMITELLTDGHKRVIGAIGIRIEKDDPEMILFQAKSVLIATGLVSRMYPGVNPAFMFNTSCCPASTGSGHAMAWRAGAKLVNLEIPAVHVGPKFFERGGKGSWIGLISDIYGRSIGPYMSQPSRKKGDITADVWPDIFLEKSRDGTGPVFMNCTNTSDEDIVYMLEHFGNDALDSMMDYIDQNKIDIQKELMEFSFYGMDFANKGIEIGTDAQTSVENLYATGFAAGNINGHSSSAAVFGMIAAEQAALKNDSISFLPVEQHPLAEEKKAFYQKILKRGETGAHWREANGTLQSIMKDYAGYEGRSDSMLTAGLNYIRQLQKAAGAQMGAENAHELMRVLEVLDMIDFAEPVFLTCRNRKESRDLHHRADYPGENEALKNVYQTIEKINGTVNLEWRRRR